ncbi:MAG: mercuric reductase [Planctomycetota bacterium]
MEQQAGKVLPEDEHNRALMDHLHPGAYTNPSPAERYDLVVIGAGPAGLVSAAGAAGLGAKVALVERRLMGGDCLTVGCVPSKCLIASARAAHDARTANDFGLRITGEVEVDFPAVMERMRRLRASIARQDSVARYTELGVDVFLGPGRFRDAASVEVAGATLPFRKAVICTGTHPFIPPIEGLDAAPCLTNETVFSLTELPRRLAVLGAGPIGCELAQAFRRFGSDVTLIHKGAHILDREDADAAEIIQQAFLREGIDLCLNATTTRVEKAASDLRLHLKSSDGEQTVEADALLVSTGRAPNVDGLALEKAGVQYDTRRGVEVDDRLRTANPNILAAGDVCSRYKFTHAADAMARMAIQNALFLGRKRVTDLTIPWCTYTDPEIGHVGTYPHELEESGAAYRTFTIPFAEVDRAVADGEPEGFVKVHAEQNGDGILGATVVHRHAGDMIGELAVAMAGKGGLGAVAGAIHPYPTQAEAIRKAGDAYSRTRLTPFVAGLLKRWLAWRR